MSETLLALHDVHVNFPAKKNWLGRVTERVHALNGMDLQIRRGLANYHRTGVDSNTQQ